MLDMLLFSPNKLHQLPPWPLWNALPLPRPRPPRPLPCEEAGSPTPRVSIMLKAGECCYKTRIFQHVYTSGLEGKHHTVNAYQ